LIFLAIKYKSKIHIRNIPINGMQCTRPKSDKRIKATVLLEIGVLDCTLLKINIKKPLAQQQWWQARDRRKKNIDVMSARLVCARVVMVVLQTGHISPGHLCRLWEEKEARIANKK